MSVEAVTGVAIFITGAGAPDALGSGQVDAVLSACLCA
jgi:hypothetical protein